MLTLAPSMAEVATLGFDQAKQTEQRHMVGSGAGGDGKGDNDGD